MRRSLVKYVTLTSGMEIYLGGWAADWLPALHLHNMSHNHSPGLQRQMYPSNPTSIHIIHSSSVSPVAEAPLACPLP